MEVSQTVGVGNGDSVKATEVEEAKGMHFVVEFQCEFVRLLSQ